MRTSLVQSAYIAIGLVLAAALQDMLPAFGGAKAPFLQVFSLHVALSTRDDERSGGRNARRSSAWIWTSIVAGYLMEALSGLPFGCCMGFMLPACAVARAVRRTVEDLRPATLGLVASMIFAPLQEAWLDAWGVIGGESAFVRFFASALPAAVVGAALFAFLPALETFAGLRGDGSQ